MLSKYQRPRTQRQEQRTVAGRMRGGKLTPVLATAFREGEGGMLTQSINFELEPIAGRMITPIQAEVISIFVPVQAMDALLNPDQDYAGNTEIIRDKLLSGENLFELENEGEISKRLGVVPRSIDGQKKVSSAARLAYNAAVNHLRVKKYVKAEKLLHSNTALTPCIISQTVLDRLNGVLDPEDQVNGSVQFDGKLNVSGIGLMQGHQYVVTTQTRDVTGGTETGQWTSTYEGDRNPSLRVDPSTGQPMIYADLGGSNSVSLTDFYQAERTDALVREMRKIVDENPEYGEEMVARWAAGLSVDAGKTPWVIYRKQVAFGQNIVRAMDGDSLDVTQSNHVQTISFSAPVPSTELGGVCITLASVKPDETLASQPHPILSDVWTARNHVADELAIDPVAVTMRELDSETPQAQENTTSMYIGNNHLLRYYKNYGFNRHVNMADVANKSALWQITVPLSVDARSILYPDNLDHYPFALNGPDDDCCTYTVNSSARIATPTIFGPSPVEELEAIETTNVLETTDETA